MGTSCHTYNGVKLDILPTLIEVFLRQHFMKMDTTKLMNSPIISKISFIDLTQSEI